MKGIPVVIAIVALVVSVCPARAQTTVSFPAAATPGPDIAGTIGWLHANKSELSDWNDWYHRSAQGAAIFGWYWSPHLKTEVEVSASTRAEFYAGHDEFIDGSRASVVSEYAFGTRRLTLGAQYQFGENAWFHPHVGTGIDVNWEKIHRFDREVYVYQVQVRPLTLVRPPVTHPDVTETHVRPFVSAGFKGYFTPRGFVRSDLRVVLGERVEEAVVRFGIGVDF